MQSKTPSTVNKTSWSKQSAVLLINIVKDVEQKIRKKELLVGKENDKTKWDYVAAYLHEASVSDASKKPNNCQYKFWELNRHFKFLLKETAGKSVAEEAEGAIFSALKGYYRNSPVVKKKGTLPTRIALFKDSRNDSETHVNTNSPLQLMKVESLTVSCATYESEDDSDGSLHNAILSESVGQLVTTSQVGEQSEDDSSGSPFQHANGELAEHLRKSHNQKGRPRSKRNLKTSDLQSLDSVDAEQSELAEQLRKSHNQRGRPRSKRKASDLQNLGSVDAKQEDDGSYRLKQMVAKMARLTSYMKWKQTGVGEDWRCDFTERIARRQKRSNRNSINNANQAHAETETQAPDEIESALREDILSFWNELDHNRPSEKECHRYFLKKYAGEVSY